MLHDRPYRKALTHEATVAELQRCAGTQFDPHLVSLFLSLLDEQDEEDESASGGRL